MDNKTKKTNTKEVNFDGLCGPTHHYGGLAFGNLASTKHALQISNPKAAALQGLEKMKRLMDLGIPQAVLPPHPRPNIPFLHQLGFRGTEHEILQKAYKSAPEIFRAAYSASSMWVANAATVCPSSDSLDGCLHITPANLITHLHRMQEAEFNYSLFKQIFADPKHFVVHAPLPKHLIFADEGAANHNRLCSSYGEPGLQIFVYGRESLDDRDKKKSTLKFPARQTLEASVAISRLHQLRSENTFFIKQNSIAINNGVFHNDVISTANQNVFLYHSLAFEDSNILKIIKDFFNHQEMSNKKCYLIEVTEKDLNLEQCVESYFFNSQIVTLPDGNMSIIAPIECQEMKAANNLIQKLINSDNPIQSVRFVDCRQSMRNGGGPACLRLRVVMNSAEIEACHPGLFLTETLYQQLVAWVNKYYRDRLTEEDLLDPALVQDCRSAGDALFAILALKQFF